MRPQRPISLRGWQAHNRNAFRDGFLPKQGEDTKWWFENLKACANPDFIFRHYHHDAHQDHRQVFRPT
jgi:LmbE family N-acetylglucosaminyl deacetylase